MEWMDGTEGRPRLRLTMLEADRSSSVRVPSSRRGTALSIATTEPLWPNSWNCQLKTKLIRKLTQIL